jgi:hypothetical protein
MDLVHGECYIHGKAPVMPRVLYLTYRAGRSNFLHNYDEIAFFIIIVILKFIIFLVRT